MSKLTAFGYGIDAAIGAHDIHRLQKAGYKKRHTALIAGAPAVGDAAVWHATRRLSLPKRFAITIGASIPTMYAVGRLERRLHPSHVKNAKHYKHSRY